MENLELRRGDLVEIKSPAEILATLDAKGLCDGLPFMPEMAQFCGKRFTVRARGAAFGRPAHGTFDRLLGFQDPGCSKRGGPVQSPCRRRRHHGVGAGAGAWSASTPDRDAVDRLRFARSSREGGRSLSQYALERSLPRAREAVQSSSQRSCEAAASSWASSSLSVWTPPRRLAHRASTSANASACLRRATDGSFVCKLRFSSRLPTCARKSAGTALRNQ
jgi:hypothetical protein